MSQSVQIESNQNQFQVRELTSLPVDAGTMCWFTCGDDIVPDTFLSYLSNSHKKGNYNFYTIQMDPKISKNLGDRVGNVLLIHNDYSAQLIKIIDTILGKINSTNNWNDEGSNENDNDTTYVPVPKYVSTIVVQNNLLISDPGYVCDNVIKKKNEDVDTKFMYWGRDYEKFTDFLRSKGLDNLMSISENTNIINQSSEKFRKLYDEFRATNEESLVMVSTLKGNLYDNIMTQTLNLVTYIDENNNKQQFIGSSTGFGDGFYKLSGIYVNNELVGFGMSFL